MDRNAPQCAAPTSPRLPGLDELKGLAIIAVVMIHATPDGAVAYRDHFIQGIPRLAVPLFLIVTGYLAGFRDTPRARLAGYFRKILALHVFYGAFYWGVSLLRDGVPDALTWKAALLHFWTGSYMGQFYLVVLVQVFFVAGIALPERAWRSGTAVGVSALAAVAGIAGLEVHAAGGAGPALEWLGRARENPVWLWFYPFSLGGFLGAEQRRAEEGGVAPGLAWPLGLALASGLVVSGAALLDSNGPILPYARMSILVGTTLLALAVPGLARRQASAPLRRLGRETFGIYVLNPAILALLYALAGRPEHAAVSWLYAAATVAMGFGASLVLRRIAPWLFP